MTVARPDLYHVLLRQVPKENIHMNKKITAYEQSETGVTISCADNTTYHGDILVGADNALSAVRQHLYKEFKERGLLSASDDVA